MDQNFLLYLIPVPSVPSVPVALSGLVVPWDRQDLVAPDNNLCERKARVLKGKINQAISLRSLEHLADFCDCLSVLDHFATENEANLYRSVKCIFKRQKPARPKPEKSESAGTGAA